MKTFGKFFSGTAGIFLAIFFCLALFAIGCVLAVVVLPIVAPVPTP